MDLKRLFSCKNGATSGHRGPPRVFISYRKTDSRGYAVALANGLATHFGKENVFLDVRGIPAGVDFRDFLWERVEWCDALLILTGPSWPTVSDETGRPRLHNPDDFVRLEIEYALDLNKRVIPVFVAEAVMPRPEQLPEVLVRVSYRQAHEMTDSRWEYDLDMLIKRIIGPRPNRFGRWGDIRRLAPVSALVANALLCPRWSNPALPLAVAIVGITTGTLWLVAVALAGYVGAFLITLFELDQARAVHARAREADRSEIPRPRTGRSSSGRPTQSR